MELHITDQACSTLAEQAFIDGTGARGLEIAIEDILRDLNFELPDRDDVAKVIINQDCFEQGCAPQLILKDDAIQVETHTLSMRSLQDGV